MPQVQTLIVSATDRGILEAIQSMAFEDGGSVGAIRDCAKPGVWILSATFPTEQDIESLLDYVSERCGSNSPHVALLVSPE